MVYRRTDHFIQLAIIGAHKAIQGHIPGADTAIYLTSGQGNMAVFTRICHERHVEKHLPRPVDFINLLSNAAGFYVAAHLGLKGKNMFLTHHRFPVQMSLLAAQNEIVLGRQQEILLGGVDEVISEEKQARKILGISETTVLGEGSNWLLLSPDPLGALGTIEVKKKALNRQALQELLAATGAGTFLAFCKGFPPKEIEEIMALNKKNKRYVYEASCGYYETLPLYVLNRFVNREKGKLIHIDGKAESCMIVTVTSLSS